MRYGLDRPDHAAELRQALDDPRRLCEALGLEIGRQKQRDGIFVCCPWHKEKSPSCSVTIKDGTIRVHCFGCGVGGDALTLVAAVRGLDLRARFREVLVEAASIAGIRIDDYGPTSPMPPMPPPPRSPPKPVLADARFAAIVAPLVHMGRLDAGDVVHYLEERGLLNDARRDGWSALPSAQAQASWCRMLGDTFPEDELVLSGLLLRREDKLVFAHAHNRLVIPWRSPEGEVYTAQRRRLDDGKPKYVFPPGRHARWPYGVERLGEASADAPIVFVEGALDVIARRELDRRKGVARLVLGVAGVDNWRSEWAAYAKGRVSYIATDGDVAGERVVERWAADLYAAGVREVRRLAPLEAKDWAELAARTRTAST